MPSRHQIYSRRTQLHYRVSKEEIMPKDFVAQHPMNRKLLLFVLLTLGMGMGIGAALVVGMFLGAAAVTAQGPKPQSVQSNPLGTAFTYQGQLKKMGMLINDACAMQFSLWDAPSGGTPVGITQTLNPITVTHGLFTARLNASNEFGANAFNGEARWLDLQVKCSGDLAFVALGRQPMTAAPYALFSAAPWVTMGSSVYYPSGNVGIGAPTPGEKLHLADGNILIDSSSERALIVKRGAVFTDAMNGQAITNPTFSLGRIVEGGYLDTDPKFRILYADDTTTERSVFEFDKKGIVASVKPTVGSHFEGFVAGDTQPLFRLNSYPSMTLEMGPGRTISTDIAIRRETTNTLTFLAGNNERLRVDSNGVRVSSIGTPFANIQAGTMTLGTGITGTNVYTVMFTSPFVTAPRVIVTPRGENNDDMFVASTRYITTTYFVVNVRRAEDGDRTWAQSLQLDWFAWQ
jgi:hypothetical protein